MDRLIVYIISLLISLGLFIAVDVLVFKARGLEFVYGG